MRLRTLFVFYCCGITCLAQDAFHNYGSLQLHNGTSVGFHLDLINDGDLSQDTGLVGFYATDRQLNISGTQSPRFFDAEIITDQGVFLNVPVEIVNNANFVSGHVITPKDDSTRFLSFLENAFYTGENDISLVDGYVSATNKANFVFPVGDDNRLRPLYIESQAANSLFKCAYFYENPDMPVSVVQSFDTAQKENEAISISQQEFWRLECEAPTKATLSWDAWSQVENLVMHLDSLRVVGWSKERNQWEDLGNTAITGDKERGTVTSDEMVPNAYEIITLGGLDAVDGNFTTVEMDNYYLSPNGDGTNDFFVLEGIEGMGRNKLSIFDRYGIQVYSKINYDNTFEGLANQGYSINKYAGLPTGIYYYVITLYDMGKRYQGYLYISKR